MSVGSNRIVVVGVSPRRTAVPPELVFGCGGFKPSKYEIRILRPPLSLLLLIFKVRNL